MVGPLPDRPARRGLRAPGRRPRERRGRRPATRPATLAASARVYTVDPKDHLRADRDAEARGLEIIGVFHSHTHTDAYPSPTDVAQAPDPGWHYVLVSLRDTPAGGAQLPDRRRRRSTRSRWSSSPPDHRADRPPDGRALGQPVESGPVKSTSIRSVAPAPATSNPEVPCPSTSACRPCCAPRPGARPTVAVEGATVGEVLERPGRQYPGLSGQVLTDDGTLHRFVNVYVNDDDVRYLDQLDTPVDGRRRGLDPAGRGRRAEPTGGRVARARPRASST